MDFETYQDVIDAYERDNMGYDTLTDYIRGENIKIAEINMDPIGDFAKIFNKKDGGMMIAIEQLGQGGITGGKTYHQYHDSFVPRDEESMGYANGGGVGSMMQPKKKIPQLVKPNKDGSRPGYRGPGGYQGGATNQGGAGNPGNSGNNNSGNTGGNGGSSNREKGIMSRGKGPKGTTGNISNFVESGPDRSAVGQFSNYGKNKMIQSLNPKSRFDPRTGGMKQNFGLGNLFSSVLGFINPIAGLFTKGIMGIPKGILSLNNKIQNSNFGRSKNLMDYLDMMKYGGYDERELARQNTMSSAKDLQARIDAGEFGTDTTGLQTNNAPKTNVNIQGKNLNDFEIGNPGGMIAPNDFEIGNPGQYATADMINEFGQSPEFNASLVNEFGQSPQFNAGLVNEFGQSPEFNASLVNEFATSPQFNTSLINEFGVKDQGIFDANEGLQYGSIPGNTDQGYVSAYGTPDDQFANPPTFGTSDDFGLMNSDAAKAAAMSIMSNAFNENVMPGTRDMNYPDRNMNFRDTGMLVADASKNNNLQTLENIINKDMYEKNLQPAIDNQNKKNQIINNPDLLKDLGIIT